MNKHLIMLAFLVTFLSAPSLAEVAALQVEPAALITKTEQAVLFYQQIKCDLDCPQSLELIQWEGKNRQKVKARMQMKDDGKLGDRKANDQVYSRRTFFKPKKPGQLYFSAFANEQVHIPVHARLSFIQELKTVYKKIMATIF
jgi:hypothetical protein